MLKCYFFIFICGALLLQFFHTRVFQKAPYTISYGSVFIYNKSSSQQRDCLNLITLTGRDFEWFWLTQEENKMW